MQQISNKGRRDMKIDLRIIFAALIPCLAHGTTIYSDNFDGDTPGLNVTPAGWTITNGGTVDVISNGSYGFPCFGNTGNCIDLDGTSSKSGNLVSPGLMLTAGQTYTASFEISGNQRSAQTDMVAVDFGTATTSFALTENAPFTLESVSFTPLTSGVYNLSFLDNSSDNVGAILDQVSVQTTPVPLPAAAWLMLCGVATLAAFSRRVRAGQAA